jgi:hypothetical protein
MKLINAILIVMVTWFTSMGSNNPVHLISYPNTKTFILDAQNYAESELKIEIIDMEKIVLMSHVLDTRDQDAIKINMKNLPDGIYSVFVEDEIKRVENKVIIKYDLLMADVEYHHISYKPIFRQTENYFDLSWMQLGEETAEITIEDNEHNQVFTETVEHDGIIQRRYDISKLEKGNYVFNVESQGASFSKVIMIK